MVAKSAVLIFFLSSALHAKEGVMTMKDSIQNKVVFQHDLRYFLFVFSVQLFTNEIICMSSSFIDCGVLDCNFLCIF